MMKFCSNYCVIIFEQEVQHVQDIILLLVRTSIGTDDDIATLPLPFCCNHCTGCSPSLQRLVTTEVFHLQHKVSTVLYLCEPKEVHVHLEDLLQLQQLFLGELLEEGGGE